MSNQFKQKVTDCKTVLNINEYNGHLTILQNYIRTVNKQLEEFKIFLDTLGTSMDCIILTEIFRQNFNFPHLTINLGLNDTVNLSACQISTGSNVICEIISTIFLKETIITIYLLVTKSQVSNSNNNISIDHFLLKKLRLLKNVLPITHPQEVFLKIQK